MKLSKFKYSQTGIVNQEDWLVNEINFGNLNLVVGKNATGKSRMLTVLKSFAKMMLQDKPVYFGDWDFDFNSGTNELQYSLKVGGGVEGYIENLKLDGNVKLERHNGETKIFSEDKKVFETIDPPNKKLVLHSRRDKKEYPYFEELVNWAQGVHHFNFGNIHSYSFLEDSPTPTRLTSLDEIGELINKLDDSTKLQIVEELNSIGYSVKSIETVKVSNTPIKYEIIVWEKTLSQPVPQKSLSQGMFRALYLIVFINYLIKNKEAGTFIIDDLGEGLDYERCTKLGTWLFTKLEGTDIQLIASTNDYFLMEVVDIKHWILLKREGNHIKNLNYTMDKELFEKFRFSGLSNFDFFASDYLLQSNQ